LDFSGGGRRGGRDSRRGALHMSAVKFRADRLQGRTVLRSMSKRRAISAIGTRSVTHRRRISSHRSRRTIGTSSQRVTSAPMVAAGVSISIDISTPSS
jgi:hypothetical protein